MERSTPEKSRILVLVPRDPVLLQKELALLGNVQALLLTLELRLCLGEEPLTLLDKCCPCNCPGSAWREANLCKLRQRGAWRRSVLGLSRTERNVHLRRRDRGGERQGRGIEEEAGEVKLRLISPGRAWLYPLNPIQEGKYLGPSHCPMSWG